MSNYDYFADLVVKMQDDGKSPSDFMEIGARLIQHAVEGADDKDAARANLRQIFETLKVHTGWTPDQ